MRCEWGVISVIAAFLSGASVGVVLYRWLRGELDIGLGLWLSAAAIMLLVIAYLARQLAQFSST